MAIAIRQDQGQAVVEQNQREAAEGFEVAATIFGIAPNRLREIRSPEVVSLCRTVNSIINFNKTLRRLLKNLPEAQKHKKLKHDLSAEPPPELKDKKIYEALEAKSNEMYHYGIRYARSANDMMCLYKASTLESLAELMKMSQLTGQVMTVKQLESITGVKVLEEALEMLSYESADKHEKAINTLYNSLMYDCQLTKAMTAKLEKEKKARDKMKEKMLELNECRMNRASACAEIDRAGRIIAAYGRSDQGSEENKASMNSELSKARKKLEEAEERRRTYTWRMWGPFVKMWENDVKLADEEIKNLRGTITLLEKGVANLNSNLPPPRKHLDDALRKKRENESQADMLAHMIDERNSEIESLHAEAKEARLAAENLMNTEGATGAEDFIQMMNAKEAFADTVRSTFFNTSAEVGPWQRTIACMVIALRGMCDARTVKTQINCFKCICSMVSGKQPMKVFLRNSNLMSDLAQVEAVEGGQGLREIDWDRAETNMKQLVDGLPAVSMTQAAPPAIEDVSEPPPRRQRLEGPSTGPLRVEPEPRAATTVWDHLTWDVDELELG